MPQNSQTIGSSRLLSSEERQNKQQSKHCDNENDENIIYIWTIQ